MRRKWPWLLVPAMALVAALAYSPRRDARERVAALLPEMRLATHWAEPYHRQEEVWLYTGPLDADEATRRLNTAFARQAGWGFARIQPGSPFPYVSHFDPTQVSALHRVPLIGLLARAVAPIKAEPLLYVRVLRGRAGAKPTGGPWATLVIRRSPYEPMPDMSEPVPGIGVFL